MDETTSRTRSTARRMASAKPASATRRTSGGKGSKKGGEPEISPLRWAGVALVIAAIVAAIVLAVVSPSDGEPGSTGPGVEASPSLVPVPTVLDTRLPTAKPSIVVPVEGPTAEYEIEVVVDVPDEDLPKRKLALVVLRGEEVLAEVDTPKTGSTVTVPGVRLLRDVENELTAALRGPGGLGPRSDPVTVTQDREAPVLALTAPANKTSTYRDTISVAGTSEPGAEVVITNEANGHEVPVVVGNAGTFKASVRLKRNVNNRIVVSSRDAAGLRQAKTVRVRRLDGRPTIKLTAPGSVKKSQLPTTIRVVVDVTDADDKKMENAEVHFSLGGPGRNTVTETGVTNANGRASWNPEVSTSNSPAADTLDLSVTVTSPQEETRVKDKAISVS